MQVHTFENKSSREVYDLTQTDEGIKNGDVLVIPNEKIVGILDEWPVAITDNIGPFHIVCREEIEERYEESVIKALTICHANNWIVYWELPF